VVHDHDGPDRVDDSVPDDVLAHWQVKKSLMASARNPLRRILVKRWIGDRDDRELLRSLHALGPPRDVAEQQAKVARADALAFIAPVYFVGFPAILKGWFERVFSLGFAFKMTADAWRGDISTSTRCATPASSGSSTSTSMRSMARTMPSGARTWSAHTSWAASSDAASSTRYVAACSSSAAACTLSSRGVGNLVRTRALHAHGDAPPARRVRHRGHVAVISVQVASLPSGQRL
jgi:putative NADPH-quinone reductase